jgi:alpha-mannosidase
MGTDGAKRLETLHLKKISNRIEEIGRRFFHTRRVPVQEVSVAETMEHLSLLEAKRLKYVPVAAGRHWGENWGTAWFRLRLRVPAEMRGETVKLLFDLDNSECLIFRDGAPVQGLCWSRKEYVLFDKADGGERVELYLEAGANARLGAFDVRTMNAPEIAVLHREVWDAYWDLSALYDIVDPKQYKDWTGKPYHRPSEHDPLRAQIIFALNQAVDLFDYGQPSSRELRAQARKVRQRLRPIYACPATKSAPTMAAMGHAHIDVAWKWPLSETIRKCGRTSANVLELMERYPEFVFSQSQPHLYEFIKERYPSLYEGIRKRVREGRWIPTGCMWVEPDCNLPSGESLVRQTLFGTRFFKKEFDCDVVSLWLPDVFGYSAALPQILRRSGIHFFFTTKLALNQFAKFPHHTFHWVGLDGSEVLAHLMPAEEYSSELEPWLIRTGAHDYAQKDRSPIQILPFGHGDGGGGPAPAHLERLKRYQDFEGMPRLESMSPKKFFSRLEAESEQLPRWVGELYLENHRGCYTTQAHTKKFNRRAEFLLRETEMLAALCMPLGRDYEQDRLNAAWKLVLLNQFHDILPGSSIDEVHRESEQQYARVFDELKILRNEALAHLSRHIDTRGAGAAVLAFNALGWERNGTLVVDGLALKEGTTYVASETNGDETPVQIGFDGKARFIGAIPSIGHKVFHIQPSSVDTAPALADKRCLENDLIKVSFDKQGRLRRVYDKRARRDVLAPGKPANQFVLFEDKMASTGAAWDMDLFYNDKPLEFDGKLVSMEIVEEGPVRAVLRIKRTISKSTIRQDIILTTGSARIDFATTIEWGDENDVLLKVAFPVGIRSERARYEVQFGSLERPTHWNMPRDFARFEVSAHKWADLSEGNYGVALLNDCKYGYDIRDNVMRLTLLRAARDPGKNADVHRTHAFTYALLPHVGDFTQGLVQEGYEMNTPVLTKSIRPAKGSLGACASQLSISGDNVIIDTIKKAEDDDTIIVRLYEAHGWHSRHALKTSWSVAKVFETDLMENEEDVLKFKNGVVKLEFTPFQIKTVKFVLTG